MTKFQRKGRVGKDGLSTPREVFDLTHTRALANVVRCPSRTAYLLRSATGRHLDAVTLLLSRGADANLSFAFAPPLVSAAWKGNNPILKLLLDHGADPDSEFRTQTALHMAAERGSLGCVEALVKAGADVNALTQVSRTANPLRKEERP